MTDHDDALDTEFDDTDLDAADLDDADLDADFDETGDPEHLEHDDGGEPLVLRGDTLQKVQMLVMPILTDLHLDLYDLDFRGGTLRITIDTPPGSEGGVNLDTLALATRLISRDLDHHDPVPGRYTLEVTSPGLERTLRTPAHFQREVGKTIAVRLRDVAGDARRVQGVLVGADDRTATILLDTPAADGSTERVIELDQVDRARTVFEWGPKPKPGKAPKSAAKKTAAPAANKSPRKDT